MRHQRLEAWTLEVVERVVDGRGNEDDRVELKAAWPADHRKAARRIAGHANQAGGDFILWIIGLDEKRRSVVRADAVEMSEWWAKVVRCFDEVHPGLVHLSVPTPHGQVQALSFTTSRAPYMITTGGREAEREVPWREGTSVRSARRSELLRSVLEEAHVPTIECHSGTVTYGWKPSRKSDVADEEVEANLRVNLDLYFETAGPCTLPAHRWGAVLHIGEQRIDMSKNLRLSGPERYTGGGELGLIGRAGHSEPDGTIRSVGGSGLHVGGNDAVTLSAFMTLKVGDAVPLLRHRQLVVFEATFPLASSTRRAYVLARLRRKRAKAPSPWNEDYREVAFEVAGVSSTAEA